MERASRRALCTVILACAVQAAQAQTRLEERYGTDFAAPPEPPPNPFALPTPGARTHLTYQYAYGVEAEYTYRRDRDLNRGVRDNEALLKPQLNGIVVWRPVNWLETTLELALEREFAVQEELSVRLPNGTVTTPPKRHAMLPVVQAFVNARRSGDPFGLFGGRRNYEDERHWLYDTSMDMFGATYRNGPFRAEASFGREVWKDMDLWPNSRQVKDRIDTYMVYGDYRGFESVRLAAYSIMRDDRSHAEGRAVNTGLRVIGLPLYPLTYWGEVSGMSGSDEIGQKMRGYGMDAGATYRFNSLPLRPNITLAYAMGSGDSDDTDRTNREFRQTGLQSNETRFGGVALFNIYGEVMAPELSNLKIVTAAVGFRPQPSVSVDVVYHKYTLHRIADENRNWQLTALMNQVRGFESKEVGSALDVVVGMRSLFGVRRLGMDLRIGWFEPGAAFLRNDGTRARPILKNGDKAAAVVMKLFW